MVGFKSVTLTLVEDGLQSQMAGFKSVTLTLVEDGLQSQIAGLDLLHLPLLRMDCNPKWLVLNLLRPVYTYRPRRRARQCLRQISIVCMMMVRMGLEPILSVKRSVSIDTMIKYDT